MADSFQVELVTAEKQVLSVEATEVYARSLDGEIGILPGHQPALLALDIAPMKIVKADGGEERVACHHGFLYYMGDRMVILADRAEVASQIDRQRAEVRKRELEERLADQEDAEVRAAIRRQETRLSVLDRV